MSTKVQYNDSEETCVCPYDPLHVVKVDFIRSHVVQCSKYLPGVIITQCIYNDCHLVKSRDLSDHLETCPNRISPEQTQVLTSYIQNPSISASKSSAIVEDEEDADTRLGYDISLHKDFSSFTSRKENFVGSRFAFNLKPKVQKFSAEVDLLEHDDEIVESDKYFPMGFVEHCKQKPSHDMEALSLKDEPVVEKHSNRSVQDNDDSCVKALEPIQAHFSRPRGNSEWKFDVPDVGEGILIGRGKVTRQYASTNWYPLNVRDYLQTNVAQSPDLISFDEEHVPFQEMVDYRNNISMIKPPCEGKILQSMHATSSRPFGNIGKKSNWSDFGKGIVVSRGKATRKLPPYPDEKIRHDMETHSFSKDEPVVEDQSIYTVEENYDSCMKASQPIQDPANSENEATRLCAGTDWNPFDERAYLQTDVAQSADLISFDEEYVPSDKTEIGEENVPPSQDTMTAFVGRGRGPESNRETFWSQFVRMCRGCQGH